MAQVSRVLVVLFLTKLFNSYLGNNDLISKNLDLTIEIEMPLWGKFIVIHFLSDRLGLGEITRIKVFSFYHNFAAAYIGQGLI
jgi:hypothetical protein